MNRNKNSFVNGMRDGIPIALGYFSVAFSLGIVAKKAGLDPFQGFLSSFLNHASAGEYAEFTVIMANAPYIEMAFVILVTNIRYMLMSCALSQKFDPETSNMHRLLVGFGITDEIFGISIGRPGSLNPYYNYGAMAIALPSWSLGTAIGIVAGNILPASVVSALSVALYGMFIAIIIPAAKENRIVGGVILVSFHVSFAVSKIALFSQMSDSMKISLLTVLIAGAAAAFFPVKEEGSDPAEPSKTDGAAPGSSIEAQAAPGFSIETQAAASSSIEAQTVPNSSVETQAAPDSSLKAQAAPGSPSEAQAVPDSSLKAQAAPSSPIEAQSVKDFTKEVSEYDA